MREASALQKLLTFFKKNIGLFQILTFEILMKCYLTTLLVLNNQAQTFSVSAAFMNSVCALILY